MVAHQGGAQSNDAISIWLKSPVVVEQGRSAFELASLACLHMVEDKPWQVTESEHREDDDVATDQSWSLRNHGDNSVSRRVAVRTLSGKVVKGGIIIDVVHIWVEAAFFDVFFAQDVQLD